MDVSIDDFSFEVDSSLVCASFSTGLYKKLTFNRDDTSNYQRNPRQIPLLFVTPSILLLGDPAVFLGTITQWFKIVEGLYYNMIQGFSYVFGGLGWLDKKPWWNVILRNVETPQKYFRVHYKVGTKKLLIFYQKLRKIGQDCARYRTL